MTSLFDQPPTPTARPKPKPAKSEQIPAWLLTQLQDKGVIDAATLATRRARTVFCRTCRHAVMRGLLPMPTPWPVDADIVPLTGEGEALALLGGRQTYELAWRGDHYELDRRTTARITARPAATLKFVDLLVEHRCGPHAAWPTATTRLAGHHGPPPPDSDLPAEPPF